MVSKARKQILIVEDDTATARLIQHRLERLEYGVEGTVATGEEAIRKVDAGRPDLVLMDITLKGSLDGIQAAKQVRDRFGTPIVFITAHEDERVLQRAKGTAPFGYILKPFNDRELRSAIEVALQIDELQKKLRQSEEHYRLLVELSPDAIMVLRNGKLVFANHASAVLLGADTPDELIGRPVLDIIHRDFHPAMKKRFSKIRKGGTAAPPVEEKFIRMDGTDVDVEVTTMPFAYRGQAEVQVVARDTTNRKRMEEALRAAHEFSSSLIESSLDMIIAVDTNRIITKFNRAAEDTFGYRQEDILGKHVNILYADPKEGHAVHEITLQNGRCIQEIWNRRKNGEVFPSLLSASVLSDARGKVVGVMGISRDITEQKRAEKALQESEEKFRTIFEDSRDAIYLSTSGGAFLDVNKAAVKLFGYSKEELMKLDIRKLYVHPDDRLKFQREIEKKGFVHDYELRLKKKDGTEMECLLTSSLWRGDDGTTRGYQGIIRDITERKRANRELVRLKEFNEGIIQGMAEGIAVMDESGRIIFVNPATESMLGYKSGELIGQKWTRIVPPDQRQIVREADKRREEGLADEYELQLLRKDGKRIDVFVSGVPRFEDGRFAGTMAVFSDITERKQTRRELEEALEKARQGERVKSLFLANMSHEIRTPLNSILGFTDLVEQNLGHLIGPEERAFFDTIRSSGERLLHTIHEILEMSQIEAGTLTTDIRELDLESLVRETTVPLLPQAEHKGVKLSLTSHISQRIIKGDEYCLIQALTNIIENAIKYTHKGKIDIDLTEKDSKLLLSIRDTGIGISPEYLDEIFEVFTQESTGYTKKFQGVGLGLALTKRYLDLCSATIDVKSEQGVGSTFTLTFQKVEKRPPKRVRKPKAGVPAVSIAEAEKKPLVLVVEDDENSQKLISFFLKRQYDVSFAVSVEEARKKLRSEPIEIILLDLSLIGEEDGLDLARRLRRTKKWKKLPIIATTAHAFEIDRENCLAAGCNDYLAKPINQRNLLETMKKWM